jgi:two-component system NtrC family response regulator
MADGKWVTELDLDLPAAGDGVAMPSLRAIRERAEIEAVLRALALTDNNISDAARLLDISRPTLYDLMKSAQIKVKG